MGARLWVLGRRLRGLAHGVYADLYCPKNGRSGDALAPLSVVDTYSQLHNVFLLYSRRKFDFSS